MNEIQRLLRAGSALLRVAAWDEEGAARAVLEAARSALGAGLAVHEWDAASGGEGEAGAAPPGLLAALDAAAGDEGPALHLLRDVLPQLASPAVARRLRRLPSRLAGRPVRVVLLTPPGELPPELARDLPTATHPLPALDTLERLVEIETREALAPGLTPRMVAAALTGLTLHEARLALLAARAEGEIGAAALERLFALKARRVQGSALEFHPPAVSFDDVGGLEAVRAWALRRAPVWRGETPGLDPPRGLLLTGVSGCGKSFAVKALSRAFGAPLFRLDMARVFAHGEPEAAYVAALAALEATAPCILWIDEVEDALALGGRGPGAVERIVGSFLTWLQERPAGVFVAATANRIELLPAELLRRGRFDQIFFVDLPDEEERKRIWSIHLRRRGLDPAGFDLIVLARSSTGWSGAEIEAAVEAARVEALGSGRAGTDAPLTRDHLFRAIARTVPLAVTMKEQIRRVKEWAHDRAAIASGKSW